MIYTFDLVLNRALTYTEGKIIGDLRDIGKCDITFGVYDYVPTVKVNRGATTLVQSIMRTIKDIESSMEGVKVQKVASTELVSIPQIAEITKLTRQSIHNLATGRYGPGGWPVPVHVASGPKHYLWRFTDIADWWSTYKLDKNINPEREHTIAAINARLRARHELSRLPEQIAKEIRQAQF